MGADPVLCTEFVRRRQNFRPGPEPVEQAPTCRRAGAVFRADRMAEAAAATMIAGVGSHHISVAAQAPKWRRGVGQP